MHAHVYQGSLSPLSRPRVQGLEVLFAFWPRHRSWCAGTRGALTHTSNPDMLDRGRSLGTRAILRNQLFTQNLLSPLRNRHSSSILIKPTGCSMPDVHGVDLQRHSDHAQSPVAHFPRYVCIFTFDDRIYLCYRLLDRSSGLSWQGFPGKGTQTLRSMPRSARGNNHIPRSGTLWMSNEATIHQSLVLVLLTMHE